MKPLQRKRKPGPAGEPYFGHVRLRQSRFASEVGFEMRKSFACSLSPHFFGLSMGAVAWLSFLCMSTPADAEQCGRGQIYWKSKKTCVDKVEAAKLGFYHGPLPNKEKQAPDETSETPPTPAEAVSPPSPAPETSAPPKPPSPYGELVLEEFTKAQ